MKKLVKKLLVFILAMVMGLALVPSLSVRADEYTDEHKMTNIKLKVKNNGNGILTWDAPENYDLYDVLVTNKKTGEKYYPIEVITNGGKSRKLDVFKHLREQGADSGNYIVEIYGEYLYRAPYHIIWYYTQTTTIELKYNNPNPKLAAPKNIKYDDNTYMLSWDPVPNAQEYLIEPSARGRITVQTNQLNLFDYLYYGVNTSNDIEITAKAEGYPNSEEVTVNINATRLERPSVITFNVNYPGSNETATRETDYKGHLSVLPKMRRSGYNFLGWYTKAGYSDRISTSTTFENDTNVYAHWEPKIYNIKINGGKTDAGLAGQSFATIGQTVNIEATGETFTSTFNGWEVVSGDVTIANKNSKKTTFVMGSSDVEISAKYTYIDSTIKDVFVYVKEPVAGEKPENAVSYVDAYEVSYTGWYDVETNTLLEDSDVFVAGKKYMVSLAIRPTQSIPFENEPKDITSYVNDSTDGVTNDGSFLIHFIKKTYVASAGTCTVKYDANGGSGTMAEDVVKKGENLILPDNGFTAPKGKVFDKWDVGESGTDYTVNSDVTIKAIWKDNAEGTDASICKVIFDTDGGNEIPMQYVEKGCRVSKPDVPTKTGYYFGGWYGDSAFSVEFDFSKEIITDTTIYAKWIEITSGNGFVETDEGTMYIKDDGTPAKAEWINVDGTYYYINSNGYTASNEWVNGYWINEDGSWTYEGKLEWKQNSTGWWVEDSKGWYPVNSWQKIDGVWYYFNASGYMASNEYYNGYWFNADGSWDPQYFLTWKSNSTGWWVEDKSGWWPSSQWLKIDGCWYYFDASGYMVTNQYVDGYWIGADGVCE